MAAPRDLDQDQRVPGIGEHALARETPAAEHPEEYPDHEKIDDHHGHLHGGKRPLDSFRQGEEGLGQRGVD